MNKKEPATVDTQTLSRPRAFEKKRSPAFLRFLTGRRRQARLRYSVSSSASVRADVVVGQFENHIVCCDGSCGGTAGPVQRTKAAAKQAAVRVAPQWERSQT